MKKKCGAKAKRDELLQELGSSELREVTGRGRLRIPIGYTETGEPIYGEDDGGDSDEDGF